MKLILVGPYTNDTKELGIAYINDRVFYEIFIRKTL